MADNKAQQYGVIEGTLVYAKLAEPSLKYQSKDTEYTVSVIVDEDTADEWDAKFKKQPAKKVKASEFEGKYKIELPEQFKGAKNVFEIKLKKDATKDGEPFFPEYRPKVFLDNGEERTEISESRLIANGTVGKVSYRISSNDFGTFAKLNNVLIQEADFIEYVSTNTGGAGSEFGDSKPVKKEPAKESATKARANKAEAPKKTTVPQDSNDDGDAPF